jgi:hypothetical protein
MENNITPIQALNAVFNFARSVAAPAAQHDQIRTYCEQLAKVLEDYDRLLKTSDTAKDQKPV